MHRILTALAIVTLLAVGAQAVPFQYSATVSNMPTSFDPVTGVYSVSGTRTLVMFDKADGSEEVVADTAFTLSTTLVQDNSSGGMLNGLFEGGTFSFQDSLGNDMLSGTIGNLWIVEQNDEESLLASGMLTFTGGQLYTPEIDSSAYLYNLNFSFDPSQLDDFQTAFTGFSNVTVTAAVPEPATLALLGLGLAGIVVRRRKK